MGRFLPKRKALFLHPIPFETLESRVLLSVAPGTPNDLTFHYDSARTGFNQNETTLTPTNVASNFGQLWQSPALDGKLYASPLYADNITITSGGNTLNGGGVVAGVGKTLGVVFAATGGSSVYAIKAFDTNGPSGIAPGTILWRSSLGTSSGSIDGNSIGVLGTPIIDLLSNRIYVCASVLNPGGGNSSWEVFALNLSNGAIISNFPVLINQTVLQAVNQNNLNGTGNQVLFGPNNQSDNRGALNLSADGSTLYVDFAAYGSSNGGWMVTVATGISNGASNGQTPAVNSAYSGTNNTSAVANGGMWGAGGPAIDSAGNVFVTTGDSPGGTKQTPGSWGNSVLEWGPGQTLTLTGAYTPWNYQTQDNIDSDMGGSSPVIINLPAGSSTTPELLVTGGKQGNGYLVDAGNHLNNPGVTPASLTTRPPAVNPNQDPSLYDPNAIQTNFSPPQAGPLSLFSPYSELQAMTNYAKSRDTPSTFVGPDGSVYVAWTGSSKTPANLVVPAAPSVVVTKVVTSPGQPAYLQIVRQNTAVMSLPGAGLTTGNGTTNEIYWVVDAGVQRTDPLDFSAGAPTLYAFDALTMTPLWSSAYQELNQGGKYNTLAIAHGVVFAGTDRIQAFGITANTSVDDSVAGAGTNQFNYSGSGWTHFGSNVGVATMGTYNSSLSTTNVAGDFATMTFTGKQIKVYADKVSGYGTVAISIDGGAATNVSLNSTIGSPNASGQGNVLVFTSPVLGAGTHTLKILDTANTTVSIDRVEIVPQATTSASLNVSTTDGGVTAVTGQVLQYTITYNNYGSIQNSNGASASNVAISETVPQNTSFNAANSTSGWTLISGTGGAGSTYKFTVGSLSAGDAGSVVFAVAVNGSVPAGTAVLTNNVSITDTAGDTSAAQDNTPIGASVAYKLTIGQQPSTSAVGSVMNPAITVNVNDQYGALFTVGAATTITLTLNGGTFVGGGNTAAANTVGGVATFSNLRISAAGTYTLTATAGTLINVTSSSFQAIAATKLGILQQPLGASSGAAMSPAVKIAVQDQNGNTITGDGSNVTLTLTSGTFATGLNTVTVQAIGGIATFSNLVVSTPGAYSFVASDGTLTTVTSNSFNVTAPAAKLSFAQPPSNVSAGSTITPAVQVSVQDSFGNIITTDNSSIVTLTLSTGGSLGQFSTGLSTVTASVVNGIATFSNLVINNPAIYSVVASDGSLTTATSPTFAVGTPAAVSIDDTTTGSGNNQIVYGVVATNWALNVNTTLLNAFNGTVTNSSNTNDTAVVTFNATQITFYAGFKNNRGIAAISIDGGPETLVDLYANDAVGFCAAAYTSPLLTVGTHTMKVRVTGNRNSASQGTIVSIDRFVTSAATPTITWPKPADIVYGAELGPTQLNATSNVPGTFSYSPVAGTVLTGGNNQPLSVLFTPTDTLHYNTSTATVLINVQRATEPYTWDEIDTLIYGEPLGETQLDAFVPAPGHFAYFLNYGTPQQVNASGNILNAGDGTEITALWTPDDTNKYNPLTITNDVDVDRAAPTITWPTPADINFGTALSSVQLNATASALYNGTPTAVPGTFAYTPAAGTKLNVGQNQTLNLLFTPTDGVNYVTAVKAVQINVLPQLVRGDFNRDGVLDSPDVSAMLQALTDLTSYATKQVFSDDDLRIVGDINHDGAVNNLDIQPLLDLLSGVAADGSTSPLTEQSIHAPSVQVIPVASGILATVTEPKPVGLPPVVSLLEAYRAAISVSTSNANITWPISIQPFKQTLAPNTLRGSMQGDSNQGYRQRYGPMHAAEHIAVQASLIDAVFERVGAFTMVDKLPTS
jgi:hypothetical protein